MPRSKKVTDMETSYNMPPAASGEEREKMLVSLAYDLVERRLLDGSASSQEVVTILKLGTMRERLERDNLERKNELLTAQADAARSQKRAEVAAEKAIEAILRYRGGGKIDEEEELY